MSYSWDNQLESFLKASTELSEKKGIAPDLLQFWGDRIGKISDINQLGPDAIFFKTNLLNVRVRGLGIAPVPCLILGRLTESSRAAINEIVRATDVGRILGFVICVTSEGFQHLRSSSQLIPDSAVVISCEDIRSMVTHNEPLALLKRLLHNQIPFRLLIPFSTSDNAIGNMFIGRTWELETMVYENQDFALCGAGGMGKSTLLRQVHWMLKQKRNPRAGRIVYADMSTITDLDAAAREIALRIGSTKVAHDANLQNLDHALRRLHYQEFARFGEAPIELVLDEMGDLLKRDRTQRNGDGTNYQLMRMLKNARNMNVIRLTLSARTETDMLLQDEDNPFVPEGNGAEHHASRLRPLKLLRFTEAEAEALLLDPLRDLGYPVERQHSYLMQRLRMCLGIPVQIQEVGLSIADDFAKQRRLGTAV